MRRLYLVAAVTIVFALGVLMGSLLTPAARAQEKETTPPITALPKMVADDLYPLNPAAPVYLAYGRWQVLRVPAPTAAGVMTVLLDTQGGDVYMLQVDRFSDTGVSWVRIPRRLSIDR